MVVTKSSDIVHDGEDRQAFGSERSDGGWVTVRLGCRLYDALAGREVQGWADLPSVCANPVFDSAVSE